MKRLSVLVIVLIALSLLTASLAFGVDVHRIKSGLNYVNPALVQDGYPVFYSSYKGGTIAMTDNYGNLVHYWHSDNTPLSITGVTWPQVWENGNVIISMTDPTGQMSSVVNGTAKGVGGDNDTIFELDWDSKIVWDGADYFIREDYASHHDWKKMWNKTLSDYTYLSLTTQAFGPQDAVALGVDPKWQNNYANGWSPDGMVEVNQDGETVWSWTFADHVVQNYDPTKTAPFINYFGYATAGATYGEPVDFPGKIDFNHETDHGGGPAKDWTHCNSIDYNPRLGHIVVNAKNMSEIYVIDHDNTFVSGSDWQANIDTAKSDAGDFIYRFGNPWVYGQGERGGYMNGGDHQFYGAHNIQWIGAGDSMAYSGFEAFGNIPGQGNMIIFDNGCWNPTGTVSVTLEWNPFLNADGVNTGWYVNPPDAGYTPGTPGGFGGTALNYSKQVTWWYAAGTGFYSMYISGQQRMPNGNTIVCSGAQSHFFEVTADKKLAWEYFNPQIGGGFFGVSTGDYVTSVPAFGFAANGVPSTFRCQKIPAGHPALEGKTLAPIGNLRQLVLEEAGPSAANELKKYLGTF